MVVNKLREEIMVRVRFAPSPTGFLHVGGVRTALYNYVFAKKNGGDFILRIEDTDEQRSAPEFEADIISQLKWLGMTWDEGPDVGGPCAPYRQKERALSHKDAAEKMLASGTAFKDPDGSIRLKYTRHEIVVDDLICGRCVYAQNALGPEPVLLRADGTPTFHLAVVVDDLEMGITHIIRGQDHLTNSAKHILIFEALGGEVPKFAHLPLALGTDGTKLSKRNSGGMVLVKEFKEQGYLPEALINFLALLGWSHPDSKEEFSLEEMVEVFDLEKVHRSAAIFDLQKLDWLNGKYIRALDEQVLVDHSLQYLGTYKETIEKRGMAFWKKALCALRDGISRLDEVPELARLISEEDLVLNEEAKEALNVSEFKEALGFTVKNWQSALQELATDDGADCYTEEQFSKMLNNLKKEFAGNKKFLFQSLRLAITGSLHGFELKILVPLIKRDILVTRAEIARGLL
jgi:nondiscriminating glutamyl-tRNA synthetase